MVTIATISSAASRVFDCMEASFVLFAGRINVKAYVTILKRGNTCPEFLFISCSSIHTVSSIYIGVNMYLIVSCYKV